MNSSKSIITALGAIVLFAANAETALADGWELRTARQTVPGTLEIEQGEIAQAIQISTIHLPHASPQKKVAVLNNLCIGHIMTKDFDQAEAYCDQAVERPNEKSVSYNNRGVLKALQGDVDAAMQDFAAAATAGCVGECAVSADAPTDLPRPVARRNLGKAEYLAQQSVAARRD